MDSNSVEVAKSNVDENSINIQEENLWSLAEINFQIHIQHSATLKDEINTVRDEFESKLRQSFYASFLKECNPTVKQNEELLLHKLGMLKWDLKHKEYLFNHEYIDLIENRLRNSEFFEKECTCFNNLLLKKVKLITQFDNNFTDDPLGFLENLIMENGCVDFLTIYRKLKFLRLVNTRITVLDESIKEFKNLEILSLSGNFIRNVSWNSLPRKLKFLQLYSNFITSFWTFAKTMPPGLIFLGLGRNFLTSGSGFHLLKDHVKHLHILDVSDNNIEGLESILSTLSLLPHLRHLNLEGNPCAVSMGYRDAVIVYFQELITLDSIFLKHIDFVMNPIYEPLLHNYTGCLIFNCYRIMGLPPPPNEVYKKDAAQSWFYIQINTPLLDPEYRKGFVELKPLKSERKRKFTKTSIYEKENECKYETIDMKTDFESDRKDYSTKIEFHAPTIIIPAPDNDLTALRDTFRTAITVKLIYCVTYTPGGATPTKSNSSRTNRRSKDAIVFKKITLAKFECHLKQVNWCESSIDFYWDELRPHKKDAIAVEGSLKTVKYGVVQASKPHAIQSETSRIKERGSDRVVPLPTFLTIHVGFGLSRLEWMDLNNKSKHRMSLH